MSGTTERGGGCHRSLLRRGVLSAMLGLLLLAGLACYRDADRGVWTFGEALLINVSNVEEVPQVAYVEDMNHYVIQPTRPGHNLAVAKLILVNNQSSRTSLLIDETAVYVSGSGSARYVPVDPYLQREEVAEALVEEGEFLPFLWGTVELEQDFQIEGWMIFEVPEKADLRNLFWSQADTIRVRLKE